MKKIVKCILAIALLCAGPVASSAFGMPSGVKESGTGGKDKG